MTDLETDAIIRADTAMEDPAVEAYCDGIGQAIVASFNAAPDAEAALAGAVAAAQTALILLATLLTPEQLEEAVDDLLDGLDDFEFEEVDASVN